MMKRFTKGIAILSIISLLFILMMAVSALAEDGLVEIDDDDWGYIAPEVIEETVPNSGLPTEEDLIEVTPEPTEEPTPTPEPTAEPTPEPTATPEPTPELTPEPTQAPTPEPTAEPTPEPTPAPVVEAVVTEAPAADGDSSYINEETPAEEPVEEPEEEPEAEAAELVVGKSVSGTVDSTDGFDAVLYARTSETLVLSLRYSAGHNVMVSINNREARGTEVREEDTSDKVIEYTLNAEAGRTYEIHLSAGSNVNFKLKASKEQTEVRNDEPAAIEEAENNEEEVAGEEITEEEINTDNNGEELNIEEEAEGTLEDEEAAEEPEGEETEAEIADSEDAEDEEDGEGEVAETADDEEVNEDETDETEPAEEAEASEDEEPAEGESETAGDVEPEEEISYEPVVVELPYYSSLLENGAVIGSSVRMSATLDEYEGYDLASFQWFYSVDGGSTWVEAEGYTESGMYFILSNNNWYYTWKVVGTFQKIAPQSEPAEEATEGEEAETVEKPSEEPQEVHEEATPIVEETPADVVEDVVEDDVME